MAATGHLSSSTIGIFAALLPAQTWLTFRSIGRRTRIAYADDTWTMTSLQDGSRRCGVLVQAHYRSSWLLVLVFETEHGRQFTEEFWRDAVSAQVFSRLSFAALYGTRPAPTSRNRAQSTAIHWRLLGKCRSSKSDQSW